MRPKRQERDIPLESIPGALDPEKVIGKRRRVPVVGTTQAGPPDRIWEELGYPVGWGDGFLEVFTNDANAYALRVVGDSMTPRLLEGEFVLVSPNSRPTPGEEVVARTLDGQVMVKVLQKLDDREAILTSLNDQYQRQILDRASLDYLHPVIGTLRRSALRHE